MAQVAFRQSKKAINKHIHFITTHVRRLIQKFGKTNALRTQLEQQHSSCSLTHHFQIHLIRYKVFQLQTKPFFSSWSIQKVPNIYFNSVFNRFKTKNVMENSDRKIIFNLCWMFSHTFLQEHFEKFSRYFINKL